MEPVSSPPVGEEFYIPHKAVVREAAESTKLPFVYVTLFGKTRLNENSVLMHFECVDNAF